MFWTENGEVPRYIRVRVDDVDKTTGEILRSTFLWTTESKISFVPSPQEKGN